MSRDVSISRWWLALISLAIATILAFAFPTRAQVQPNKAGSGDVRRIAVDIARGGEPLDRLYDFSVGADYSGTSIRPESADVRIASLAPRQYRVTRDLPESDRRIRVGSDGRLALPVPMRSNDVVLVTLEPVGRPAPR